jgi:hypothetical protein
MYRVVLLLSWFAGTIYATIPLFCLGLYPFSQFWRERRPPLHVVIPAWLVMVAAVDLTTWPWREAVLYHWPAAWAVAAVLFATAIVIYHRSRLDFSHVRIVGRIEPKHGPVAFFRGSHTTSSVTCGFSKSYNHAAQVPSSNVTCKSLCSPWTNCRMVLALVSTMDSITSFPSPVVTAIEIVSW